MFFHLRQIAGSDCGIEADHARHRGADCPIHQFQIGGQPFRVLLQKSGQAVQVIAGLQHRFIADPVLFAQGFELVELVLRRQRLAQFNRGYGVRAAFQHTVENLGGLLELAVLQIEIAELRFAEPGIRVGRRPPEFLRALRVAERASDPGDGFADVEGDDRIFGAGQLLQLSEQLRPGQLFPVQVKAHQHCQRTFFAGDRIDQFPGGRCLAAFQGNESENDRLFRRQCGFLFLPFQSIQQLFVAAAAQQRLLIAADIFRLEGVQAGSPPPELRGPLPITFLLQQFSQFDDCGFMVAVFADRLQQQQFRQGGISGLHGPDRLIVTDHLAVAAEHKPAEYSEAPQRHQRQQRQQHIVQAGFFHSFAVCHHSLPPFAGKFSSKNSKIN